MTSKVIHHPYDPVFVGRSVEMVELQIGESERGKSRFALLTAVEARILAYSLFAEAERVPESPIPPPE